MVGVVGERRHGRSVDPFSAGARDFVFRTSKPMLRPSQPCIQYISFHGVRSGDAWILPKLGMNGAVPLFPLYSFMAWTGKHFRLGSLIVGILFQKYLNAGARGSIQMFRYATGTHSPTHMHHQLHIWHEKEKQASENLCSQLMKCF
jgi:hypothetical protein